MADQTKPEEKKKQGSMLIAIIAVLIALLLLVGAIAAVLMFTGDKKATAQPIDAPSLGDPVAGRQVAMRADVNCIFCHSDDGSAGQGPTFKGLWGSTITYDDGSTVLLDDKAIRWTLKNPNEKIVEGFEPRMPPDIDTKLSETDRVNLLAYLRSIGKGK